MESNCGRNAFFKSLLGAQGRAHYQAGKLRLQLDGQAQLTMPFPERPPRMHRRTYDRLRREGMNLEARLSKRMRKRFPDYASSRCIYRLGFRDRRQISKSIGSQRKPRAPRGPLILDDFGLEPLDAGARHDSTCSKSSKSGMAVDRRSSHPSSLYLPGMRSLATPLTPTPFWTASSTMLIASSSSAKASTAPEASSPKPLDPKPS